MSSGCSDDIPSSARGLSVIRAAALATIAIFSLRTAAIPSAMARAFASSAISLCVRIQSRILLAISTLLRISFFAVTVALALSRMRLVAASNLSLACSSSTIRTSKAPLAAPAAAPDQTPIPAKSCVRSRLRSWTCCPTAADTCRKDSASVVSASSSTSGHAGGAANPYGSSGRGIAMRQPLAALQALWMVDAAAPPAEARKESAAVYVGSAAAYARRYCAEKMAKS